MKLVKVLGTDNCVNCTNLKNKISQIIDSSNYDAKVEKITNIVDIMGYGVMSVPAVVVDEELKCFGRSPSETELHDWLK
ncbi:MAG: thioredoxin family protein [Alphaproteobacteria bacterium]|nr:thioredoxin family protein [Alphaproteobacteria bacterium]MBN2674853.1 thioredoxin family protein [Alphaproteobacteria bacterium]